jgi:hypothetical protein
MKLKASGAAKWNAMFQMLTISAIVTLSALASWLAIGFSDHTQCAENICNQILTAALLPLALTPRFLSRLSLV